MSNHWVGHNSKLSPSSDDLIYILLTL
jgi:hypothetical protein